MIADKPLVLLRQYGHNTMYALRSTEGLLCYRFWSHTLEATVLFTEPKVAQDWLKKVAKAGYMLQVQPVPVTAHPEGMTVAINPAEDGIGVILKKLIWRNW